MRVLAHVEPVAGAGRHRDQVVALAEHGVDMLLDMQDEQAAPGDEEAHLVFAMAVLVEELGAQFGLLRVVAVQADHVHGDVAALALEPLDLVGVGGDHLVLAGAGGDGRGGFPAFETDADLGQGRSDVLGMGQQLQRLLRLVLVIDGKAAHRLRLSTFSSHSNRNSKAST